MSVLSDLVVEPSACLLPPSELLRLCVGTSRIAIEDDDDPRCWMEAVVDGGRALGRLEETSGIHLWAIAEDDARPDPIDEPMTVDDLDHVTLVAVEWAVRIASDLLAADERGTRAMLDLDRRRYHEFLLCWGGRWIGRIEAASGTHVLRLRDAFAPGRADPAPMVRAVVDALARDEPAAVPLPRMRTRPFLDARDLSDASRWMTTVRADL